MKKEEKRRRLFKKAFLYLKKEGKIKTQKDLADKIGIGTTPVSHLMNGTSLPSYETLLNMNKVFNNIFNLDYFIGDSEVMLVADLKEKPLSDLEQQEAFLEEKIAMLQDKVADKEETIASLKRELACKDALLANMKQQVADMRSMLNFGREKTSVEGDTFQKGRKKKSPTTHI